MNLLEDVRKYVREKNLSYVSKVDMIKNKVVVYYNDNEKHDINSIFPEVVGIPAKGGAFIAGDKVIIIDDTEKLASYMNKK